MEDNEDRADVALPLPAGEVTFLFTDIQGSTPLWECEPDAMRESLATHNRILHTAVAGYGGHVYKIIGDAFQAAFANPIQALNAALAGQRELAAARWNRTGPLRVRMGLHIGPAEVSGADYAPSHTLNRVARIMSAAHGGQALTLYRQMKNRKAIAELLVDAGGFFGDIAQRRTCLEEGLALCRERGDLFSIAKALNHLGSLAMWQGNFEQARSMFEESITIHRLFGTALPIGALQHLGILALREGNYLQARSYLEESLSLSQNAGQQSSGAWAIAHLGYVALRQGDEAQARARFTPAQHLFEKGGLKIGVVYTLEGFASLAVQQGRPERATRLFAWADATRDAIHQARPPVEQVEVDRDLEAIRDQIDEAMATAAQAEERAMTMEAAIAYALAQTGQNDKDKSPEAG